MKIALTIAGSDSCGGAGLQQDLKVFSSLGVHGATVITAVTAQNTRGMEKGYVMKNPDSVAIQLDTLFSDMPITAVKTGMLGSKEIVSLVNKKVKDYQIDNLVVDPVLKSTNNYVLLEESALAEMRKLVSLAKVSTPNREEAETLTGMKINCEEDLKKAAEKIGNCIITGGENGGTDLAYLGGNFYELESQVRIERQIHGTGCAFSAAITAFLAREYDLLEAVNAAKKFMDEALARNFQVGKGAWLLDTAGINLGRDYQDRKKRETMENVCQAIEAFCSHPRSHELIPEVGINIAMALPQAKNSSQIAALSGRIVRDRAKAIAVGSVDFGGSQHLARIVLAALQFDREKRAAMNIRYDPKIVETAKKLGLTVSTFRRQNEPAGKKTMDWGTKEAIEQLGQVPDIIYDRGGVGKEAMIRLLGKDAEEVVEIALRIVREIR